MIDQNLWIVKTVSDEDRAYKSIEGYNDTTKSTYNYDDSVPNHRQLKVGDVIIIVNKIKILGFAKVESIATEKGLKIRRKCPHCGATNYDARLHKSPLYRCNRGHEFDEPIEETVDSIKFKAEYPSTFIEPSRDFSISEIRPYYKRNYNRNLSIQALDVKFLEEIFPAMSRQFFVRNSYPGPDESAELLPIATENPYQLSNVDERAIINSQIKARRGQRAFRMKLMTRYGERCMVTGCKIKDILEAAHISPYRGVKDNNIHNGLILRSDVHTLFDLDLIGIEPDRLEVKIADTLKGSSYDKYDGVALQCGHSIQPSTDALRARWQSFQRRKESSP
ncbi:HNH endonuclease [Chryseolinea soli]|uniref:HNH endonuclease n=1 Tax=Chryseolinea soli TaxID=2321403 RepID=A0A385SPT9_9BACT|nr:HNH endonuclease signature motif containing protein [Chryseolinea soli]AYB30978.1 HNH endonuclease [Chryseolinea soli]